MTDTGWIIAGAGVSDDTVGAAPWVNANKIIADDATDTSVSLPNGAISEYLKATNFDFTGTNLANADTIEGIEVRIERGQSSTGIVDTTIKMVNTAGSIVGENKSATAAWGTYPDVVSWGGTSDTWGNSFTGEDALNSNFGVVFNATSTAVTSVASVDYIAIKLHYSRKFITEGTGTVGTRIIDKDYPVTEGLEAGTTKQTGDPSL